MEFLSTFSGVLFFIIIQLGMPVCLIWMIACAIAKKNWKRPLKILGVLIVVAVILAVIGVGAFTHTKSWKESHSEKSGETEIVQKEITQSELEVENEADIVIENVEVVEEEIHTQVIETETASEKQEVIENGLVEDSINMPELSEDEYKEVCKHIFYDEVFFGEEDLEGEFVKINLFVSEEYYFTTDNMYNSSIHEFYTDYNLYRDFLKCCVLHEDANSYVGSQMSLYFTQDYELNPSDYEPGDKITIYGEVVTYSTNTWDGYNVVGVIPKYIDEE